MLDLRAFLQLCWFRLLLLRSFGCEHVKASGNSQQDLQIKRSAFSNKVSYFVGSVLLVGCWWFCIRFPIPLALFKTQMAFLSFIQVSLWQFVECTLRACFFSWLSSGLVLDGKRVFSLDGVRWGRLEVGSSRLHLCAKIVILELDSLEPLGALAPCTSYTQVWCWSWDDPFWTDDPSWTAGRGRFSNVSLNPVVWKHVEPI